LEDEGKGKGNGYKEGGRKFQPRQHRPRWKKKGGGRKAVDDIMRGFGTGEKISHKKGGKGEWSKKVEKTRPWKGQSQTRGRGRTWSCLKPHGFSWRRGETNGELKGQIAKKEKSLGEQPASRGKKAWSPLQNVDQTKGGLGIRPAIRKSNKIFRKPSVPQTKTSNRSRGWEGEDLGEGIFRSKARKRFFSGTLKRREKPKGPTACSEQSLPLNNEERDARESQRFKWPTKGQKGPSQGGSGKEDAVSRNQKKKSGAFSGKYHRQAPPQKKSVPT